MILVNFSFIFMFIFLIRRKATETLYIGQAITPTCFQKFQNIVVQLKFFIGDTTEWGKEVLNHSTPLLFFTEKSSKNQSNTGNFKISDGNERDSGCLTRNASLFPPGVATTFTHYNFKASRGLQLAVKRKQSQ